MGFKDNWAYDFACEQTLEEALAAFNAAGSWQWQLRDSYYYGEYLNTRPEPGLQVRIHEYGLGGMGVLRASDILADAAFGAGYDVKKSEIHGMAQRGGGISSDVRFGEDVLSPMIPDGATDILVMLEPSQTDVHRYQLREGGLFLFLPLAHSFGRLIELGGVYHDAPVVIAGIPTLADDLRAARPGFVPAAPRVYEKVKARLESAVADAPAIRRGVRESRSEPSGQGSSQPHGLAGSIALSRTTSGWSGIRRMLRSRSTDSLRKAGTRITSQFVAKGLAIMERNDVPLSIAKRCGRSSSFDSRKLLGFPSLWETRNVSRLKLDR